ncbi:ABC transporter ATP-binding protein [Clostridium tetani]|uniref:ABC transporter ATP-binding protein n=1 Tax=Clostridium tetani (strain Massachusetts / E88) TaxID=212717 RepID=Q899X7_CLOTE|nr:ABC transporter ATP-binding protein [Clostridium tetani]AAO37431.1 ABC transporter ATP-binding protein [Clostridium tetani E88]KGI36347.1 multidrug ABC transporter ATP-binding protein [Clostridium tetani]KHO30797.1 multidrug ABC transporter ATP-binding protein [Clostridium tetani]KIG19784.1 multidrug ABC transporter ATP-binding protein [Clostridium tetani]RXI60810.1 ABC transporter ATP-binding protein [Clostridium tetani]
MILINNVTKKFGTNIILENINLKLQEGNIYGFVGKNGSGKTILFKMIAGFMAPTNGEIKVYNKIIGKDVDFPTSCGIIIESPGFINNLSGYKNLKLLSDINKTISEDEIRKYMNFFGLDPYDKKKVKNYSLGMKQKLGLIQALMEDPKILILDEPMNALEEETVIKVRELLKKIKKEKIILLSSHNKEDIDLLCDRIYHVKDRHINICNESAE